MSEMCRVSWKAVVVLCAELVMKLGNDWRKEMKRSESRQTDSFTSCSVLLTHRPEHVTISHRFIC